MVGTPDKSRPPPTIALVVVASAAMSWPFVNSHLIPTAAVLSCPPAGSTPAHGSRCSPTSRRGPSGGGFPWKGDAIPVQRRSALQTFCGVRSGLQRGKILVELGEVILQRRILRRARDELCHDRPARLQHFAGFYRVILRDIGRAEFRIRHGEIMLPVRVVGIGLGDSLGDVEAVLIGLQRAGEIAPPRPARRRLCSWEAERSRCEPGVGGIGLGEPLGVDEARTGLRQQGIEVRLRSRFLRFERGEPSFDFLNVGYPTRACGAHFHVMPDILHYLTRLGERLARLLDLVLSGIDRTELGIDTATFHQFCRLTNSGSPYPAIRLASTTPAL